MELTRFRWFTFCLDQKWFWRHTGFIDIFFPFVWDVFAIHFVHKREPYPCTQWCVLCFQLGRGNLGDSILVTWQNDAYPIVNSVGLGDSLEDVSAIWRVKESTGEGFSVSTHHGCISQTGVWLCIPDALQEVVTFQTLLWIFSTLPTLPQSLSLLSVQAVQMKSKGDLDYETFALMVRSQTVLSFKVKACSSVHVKLAEIPRITEIHTYEVSRSNNARNPIPVHYFVLCAQLLFWVQT